MALVFPNKAFAFKHVLIESWRVIDVAEKMDVVERTVRRTLEGHERELGAEDWFLVLLELYREADIVYPDGANVLRRAFNLTQSTHTGLGAFHTSFALMALKSLAGGDEARIFTSLPWQHQHPEPVIAWPCHGDPCPRPHTLLPGLIAGLSRTQGERAYWFCWLNAQLAARDDSEEAWRSVALIMNHNNGTRAAVHGQPVEAETRAGVLLATQPVGVRHAILGVLACTPLSWDVLCKHSGDVRLASVPAAERVARCARQYIATL